MADKRYDVVIIGGGAMSSSVAFFLKHELKFKGSVAVIERDPTFTTASTMLSTQGIYDEVCHSLIQDWLADDRGAYDVAVFGDVLEHLPPREIRWVIRQSLRRFKHVIVICPLHDIFQEETYDNPLEMHRAYITEGFFDRCQLVEKHIVKDGAYTIMNVHLAADQDARPVWSKAARSAFHHGMLLLQPLSLARPAVTLLKRHAVKYKWLIGRTSA